MKSEKKTMIIWVLSIVAIVLALILAVVVFGGKNTQQANSNVTNDQGTQMAQGTAEHGEKDMEEHKDVKRPTSEQEQPQEEQLASEQEQPQEEQPTSEQEQSREEQPTPEQEQSQQEQPTSEQEQPQEEQPTSEQEQPQEEQPASEQEQPREEQPTAQPEPTSVPQTSVREDGSLSPLHLDGTQLCDEAGPIQLRGISTHGLAWFPQFVNEECFKMFKEEWNANVVRLAMYTAENGGYCTDGNKSDLKKLVKDGVAYATNVGLYVIIDWHVLNDRNPNTYKEEAKAFFREMSTEYKDYTNVIYEVCNEPNGGVGWQEVKSYAEEVIEVIRENDEDAIIIVGTPNWSQYVDNAAADPITTSDNIMYALHFYAATHKDDLRSKMKQAVDNGLPIFVSEYGICDASGNGGIDEGQANAWVEAMDDLGISYIAWNLANKNETSSIIKSSCNKTSGFTKDDLSASGKWLYEMLTGKSAEDFKPSNTGDNAGQGNQQENQNNQSSSQPEPAKAPVANVSTGDGLSVQAQMKDSWGGDGGTSYNYSLTITNHSGSAIDGWNITLQFTDTITAVQGWSGNFTIEGSSLHISNVDYNGSIAAGESKQDIGFIITGSDSMKMKQ